MLSKRKRQEWELNVYKPFDLADIESIEAFLKSNIKPAVDTSTEGLSINDINKRMSTNKAVIDEVFERIASGTLMPINAQPPLKLGDLVFDKETISKIIGNSHAAGMMTAEQLSKTTDWKSESIRHWIKNGILAGEICQLRGRPAYSISLGAIHQFMKDYKVVSELAKELDTTSKVLTERLRKMGIPIVGTQTVSPEVIRGGLVQSKNILVSGLYQPQAILFDGDECVEFMS